MPSKTQSILIAALVGTVLSTITGFLATSQGGLQMVAAVLGCLVMISVPLIAVWHYTTTHQLTLAAGSGAGLGAMAAVAWGVLSAIVGYTLQALGVMPSQEELIQMQREQMLSQGLTAEQIEQAMGWVEMSTGPLGIVINVVVAIVIGAVLGAIGAAIFKKGQEEAF